MLFHSFPFVVFFAVTFAVYWWLRDHRRRMQWLLVASCVFYATWHPLIVLLILFTATLDFVLARRIEEARDPATRRGLLVLSIAISLGLLAFFKYTNFLLDSGYSILRLLGHDSPPVFFKIVVPLGISFYTFETVSYVVDVYRRRIPAERNLRDYALFIMFFPHLISGPIIRPRQFLVQVRRPKQFRWTRLDLGARLFLLGLVKKAVIADQMARIVDPVFAAPATFASEAIWVAVLCFAVQVFCDFSGYSDMAIGVAYAFGFKLPINFNMPFLAQNVSEFWRRWHMSLSYWLRDYVYLELGGSRHGRVRTCWNLIVTFFLMGLWHGAGWPFLIMGLYFGVLAALHRVLPLPAWLGREAFRPLRIAATFFLIAVVGFVFFRAASATDAFVILRRMFVVTEGRTFEGPAVILLALAGWIAIIAGHALGAGVDLTRIHRLPVPVLATGLALVFLIAQTLIPASGPTFVYFRF
jgi:alginate O-acetyltransferase complex protein AlgI